MMRRLVGGAAIAVTIAAALTVSASACGTDSDCVTANGAYRIALPESGNLAGAIMFFHGWQGSAAGVMRNKALRNRMTERGVAVIAPNGLGKSWSYPGSPSQRRDEFAFIEEVLADIEDRFQIPGRRIMASGFSIGGSMTWYLACRMGDEFGSFAPIAGAFWMPLPESCPSPIPDLIHVHGTADRMVPIAGRPIRDRWHQGDVYKSFGILIDEPACVVGSEQDLGRLTCQEWASCDGRLIQLCLHEGGHSLRTEWVSRAWDMFAEKNDWKTDIALRADKSTTK